MCETNQKLEFDADTKVLHSLIQQFMAKFDKLENIVYNGIDFSKISQFDLNCVCCDLKNVVQKLEILRNEN